MCEEGDDVCMCVCSAEVQQKAPCVYLDAVCKNVMCVLAFYRLPPKGKRQAIMFHECLCECVCVSVSKTFYEFLSVFFIFEKSKHLNQTMKPSALCVLVEKKSEVL